MSTKEAKQMDNGTDPQGCKECNRIESGGL